MRPEAKGGKKEKSGHERSVSVRNATSFIAALSGRFGLLRRSNENARAAIGRDLFSK